MKRWPVVLWVVDTPGTTWLDRHTTTVVVVVVVVVDTPRPIVMRRGMMNRSSLCVLLVVNASSRCTTLHTISRVGRCWTSLVVVVVDTPGTLNWRPWTLDWRPGTLNWRPWTSVVDTSGTPCWWWWWWWIFVVAVLVDTRWSITISAEPRLLLLFNIRMIEPRMLLLLFIVLMVETRLLLLFNIRMIEFIRWVFLVHFIVVR